MCGLGIVFSGKGEEGGSRQAARSWPRSGPGVRGGHLASCVETGPLKPDPQGHFRVPGGYPVSLPHLLRWAPLSSPRDLQETEAQRAGQAFLLPQKVPGPSRSAPQTQVACGLGRCPSVTLACGSPSRGPESPCARVLLPASVSPGGCCPGAGPHMSRSSPRVVSEWGQGGHGPCSSRPLFHVGRPRRRPGFVPR